MSERLEAQNVGYSFTEILVTSALLTQLGLAQGVLPRQRIGGEAYESQTELGTLDGLLQYAAEQFGFEYEIIEVGENGKYGYIAVLNPDQLDVNKPLRLTDMDDCLIATSAAKPLLGKSFVAQLATDGIELDSGFNEVGGQAKSDVEGSTEEPEPPEEIVNDALSAISNGFVVEGQDESSTGEVLNEPSGLDEDPYEGTIKGILDAADKFSRWEEDGYTIHHLDAQYMALSWARRTLVELKGLHANEDVAKHIVGVLRRMSELSGDLRQTAGPLFDRNGGKLVSAEPELINEAMSQVVTKLLRPEIYEATLDFYRKQQTSGDANTGVMTLGSSGQQLIKFLEVIAEDQKKHEDLGDKPWIPNYVFLTKVDKGTFVRELLQNTSTVLGSKTACDLMGREEITYVDDDPSQIDAIFFAKLPLNLTVFRALIPGTKRENVSTGPNGITLDLTDPATARSELSKITAASAES